VPFAEQTAEGGSLVGQSLPELEKDALVLVEQLLQDVDVSSLNITAWPWGPPLEDSVKSRSAGQKSFLKEICGCLEFPGIVRLLCSVVEWRMEGMTPRGGGNQV
jgi:hypothetical protein